MRNFSRDIPAEVCVSNRIGCLLVSAAVINVAVTDAEGKQPWALVGLVLGVPGIWVVTLLCLATFSLQVTDERVEKVLASRWVVASKPLSDLRSASIMHNTLHLTFTDGSTLRLAAMPLRNRTLLAEVLVDRCPHVKLN